MRTTTGEKTGRSGAVWLLILIMAASACTSASTADSTTTTLTVAPDRAVPEFNTRVAFGEESIEPEALYLPAGHPIRLVLRNRTRDEKHYRVIGLVAADVRFILEPQYTLAELENMSPEEQAEVGFDPNASFDEHMEHHLTPQLVASLDESPEGIRPIGGEVHGYVLGGETQLMTFFPLTTGRYRVEDPLSGETIGEVVVFVASEDG